MSYPIARISTSAVTRARTADLWRTNPDNYQDMDPTLGLFIWDDFTTPAVQTVGTASAGWFLQETGATLATVEAFDTLDGNPDGTRVLSATTGTIHQGVQINRGVSAVSGDIVTLPSATTNAKGRVVFECSGVFASAALLAVGLAEGVAAGVVGATSALVTTVGQLLFFRDNAGNLQFTARSASGGTVSTVTVIAASAVPAITKLGFAVNPDNTLELFVNEVSYPGAAGLVNPAALPTTAVQPIIAIGRGSGAAGTVSSALDWVGVSVDY